jgi:DNA-binding XRE family transcriptional regulator
MEKDCTQDMLAKLIGVQKPQISDLENGKRLPSITELMAYSKRFKAPMEYLLGMSDNRNYENMVVGQELGLSDEAIATLKFWKQYQFGGYSNILNILLAIEDKFAILQRIDEYCFSNPKEFVIAKSDKITRVQELSVLDTGGDSYSLHVNHLKDFLLLSIQSEIKELKKYLQENNITREKTMKTHRIEKVD